MNNVIYRNQESWSDALPHKWMLSNAWAWSELKFTFETATVRHTGVGLEPGATAESCNEIESSFDETFDTRECEGHDSVTCGDYDTYPHTVYCNGSCVRARWVHD